MENYRERLLKLMPDQSSPLQQFLASNPPELEFEELPKDTQEWIQSVMPTKEEIQFTEIFLSNDMLRLLYEDTEEEGDIPF